jgi:hypothetical protein
MYTKTWKIGEVCQGGIITVEIKNSAISVIGEWILKMVPNVVGNKPKSLHVKQF